MQYVLYGFDYVIVFEEYELDISMIMDLNILSPAMVLPRISYSLLKIKKKGH